MADDIDRTQDRAEALEPYLVRLSRRREAPAATGFCLNCDEPLALPLRWCDNDCRADWEKRR